MIWDDTAEVQVTVDGILALEEPWRERFLAVIEDMATYGTWNGSGEPTRETLINWLQADRGLRIQVQQMYVTWRVPEVKAGKVENQVVEAGPNAPKYARCPACGGVISLRSRKSGEQVVWFYRHVDGSRAYQCHYSSSNK